MWLASTVCLQICRTFDPLSPCPSSSLTVFPLSDSTVFLHTADTAKQLTPLQEEAIWAVAAIAEDPAFHLSLKLVPGDVELLRELRCLCCSIDHS